MEAPGRGLVRLAQNLLLTVFVGIAFYIAYVASERYFSPLAPLQLQALEAGVVVLLGYLVARSLNSAVRSTLRTGRTARHSVVVGLFLDALVGVAILLAVFHIFGVSLESVFLGSAFAAIVVGLASQTVLANVFAGFMIVLGRPFLVGERISLVSSNYGAIAPSYPHELVYPVYTGIVEDIELLYTVLRMDDGRLARVPSSVALGAMAIRLDAATPHQVRIRVTLPYAIAPAQVEGAVASMAPELASTSPGLRAPIVRVVDLSPTSWDAVVVVWTRAGDDEELRDRVLRRVLSAVPLAVPSR